MDMTATGGNMLPMTGNATGKTGGTTSAASTTTSAQADPQLQKVAQQFEAIFLRQMIGSMRSSSLAEGMFDSSATEQFRDMADAKTADEMARTSRFGIADMLMKQFSAQNPPATNAALNAAPSTARAVRITGQIQNLATADTDMKAAQASAPTKGSAL